VLANGVAGASLLEKSTVEGEGPVRPLHATVYGAHSQSDKVDPTTIEAIELAISALKEELETEDAGKIKSGIQNVTEAAMKLGEAIYKASQEDGENSDKEPGSADFDDNIVDADFEDLDDEQRS
jgi:molecular chaperone DnaK